MNAKRRGNREAHANMDMYTLELGTGPQPGNRTLYVGKDNYDVLRGIDSNSFDLVATDPPFNKDAPFVGKVMDERLRSQLIKRRLERGKSKDPKAAELAEVKFSDVWLWDKTQHEDWLNRLGEDDDLKALKEVVESAYAGHSPAMGAYISYMTARCLELKRILRPTGAIFLHCDPTASNYLRSMMNAMFGHKNFRNEIIWQRAAGRAKGSQHKSKTLGTDCDYILFYSMSAHTPINSLYLELDEAEINKKFPHMDDDGRRYNVNVPLFCQPSMGSRPNLCYTYKGVTNPHPSGWRVSREVLKEMDDRGDIIWRPGKRPLRKSYADEYQGKPVGCLWTDIPNETSKMRTGWPTQKPVKLYERLIKLVAEPGMKVLDPFCGCATTCVAAERITQDQSNDLTVEWVGIDFADDADLILSDRIQRHVGVTGEDDGLLKDPVTGQLVKGLHELLTIHDYVKQGIGAIPQRTDHELAKPHTAERKPKKKLGDFFWASYRNERKAELLRLQRQADPQLNPENPASPNVCKCEDENCQKHFTSEGDVECDHIVPVAYYRNHHPKPTPELVHHIDNLRLVCGECNRKKGARTLAKDLSGS